MGLDNGIYIKTDKTLDIPKEVRAELYTYDSNEYHICYWRKCWNIRNEIVDLKRKEYDPDTGIIRLNKNDLKDIWHILNSINRKRLWDESQSIWSYHEIRDVLDIDLISLEWVIQNYDEEWKVYFYDSY